MMIPYFKQLEKELEGEEIEFLSVCIGTFVEWDRWKKIIATEELTGHLIFINSWIKGFAKETSPQKVDSKNVGEIMYRMGMTKKS